MKFEVTILGCSSALPTADRFPTSQLLNVNEQYYLIDCGEGAQIQLRRFKFKIQRITAIFISHMHGDHYFGLPGLLSSMQLLGREKPLTICCPAPLISLLPPWMGGVDQLSFPIRFLEHPAAAGAELYTDDKVSVTALPLEHRMPTTGFLFREVPKPRKIDKSVLSEYNIPLEAFPKLTQGEDIVLADGTALANRAVTLDPPRQRSYAYCSDTRYAEALLPYLQGVDLLYHEATFLEEAAEQAAAKYHSTAKQAATIAIKAGVGKLILGHYSARYKDLTPLLEEAKAVFESTVLGLQGESHGVALQKR